MEYLEKLKVYGDQVKNVMVKSMVDAAHGGQNMLKDVLPGNLVTREFEVRESMSQNEISIIFCRSWFDHWAPLVLVYSGAFMERRSVRPNRFVEWID